MAEQEQNRSEPATPFKLEEAKKQGKVPKSLDFNSFLAVSALLLVILGAGSGIADHLAALSAWLLGSAADLRLENGADAVWLGNVVRDACAVMGPVIGVTMVFAVLANVLQTGPIFTFEPLQPRFERLNPAAGLKRVFSRKMLFEAVKTLLKLALFLGVLYGFMGTIDTRLTAGADPDPRVQMAWLAGAAASLLFRLLLVLLFIGIADLVYVRWQFNRQMMMSRRELKEELKRREGDPLIRAKIRELQRENLKQARSLGRVPEADVLITNPEHIAIALRYVRGEMSAPHVIAKGADAWAAEMRVLAQRHGIPLFERRNLARQLFRRTQLDHPVPPESFVDVARIYADLEAQRRRAARYEVVR